jgi:hypothetical protein
MVDLLDEIRDDLKDEKVLNSIKKYSGYVFALLAVIITSVALKMWWLSYKENQAYQEGAEFIVALKKVHAAKVDEAVVDFEKLANHGHTSYAALAKLHLASYYLQKKDTPKAEKFYSELNSRSTAKVFKDYAELMQAKMVLSATQPEYGKVQKNLKTYIDGKPIFKYSALEMLAIAQFRLNEKSEAIKILNLLSGDLDTPETIKSRALNILKTIE